MKLFLLAALQPVFHCFYPKPVGIFTNHADVGNPKIKGAAQYDEVSQSYNIKGGGYTPGLTATRIICS